MSTESSPFSAFLRSAVFAMFFSLLWQNMPLSKRLLPGRKQCLWQFSPSSMRIFCIIISNFAHRLLDCAHTISYVRSIIGIFALIFSNTRELVALKLTQISRISKKSLLCNALINTHPYDWAPQVGSAISDGTLPLPLHHAAAHKRPILILQ